MTRCRDEARRVPNTKNRPLSGLNVASYTYLANSPLVSQIVFKTNSTTRMTTTKQYDLLNRLTSLSSASSASGVSPVTFGYTYNDANQRTQRSESDASYWVYQYDSLGQVTSGKKYWNDGTPVTGQQFEYGFDDIGNRTSTKAGGDSTGSSGSLRSASYTANTLNQYTTRDVPNQFDVLGASHATNSVAVNGSAADYRRGEYFQELISVVNSSTSVWQTVSVTNTGGGSTTGNVFVAKTPEACYYDLDGNLTNDGRWLYTWDAENRLRQVESLTTSPTAAKRKVVWEYDGKGRRLRQTTHNLSSGDVVTEDLKFLSDGWRCLAELDAANNALVRAYVWGLDLSGSMDEAGGVGGLVLINSVANGAPFYAYDGNGNVAALVKASDGTVSAVYNYDPFGGVLRSTGAMADENRFQFSTKRNDRTTDLELYEYRVRRTDLSWLSRDPIEERGGYNLYGFIGNDGLNQIDPDGLAPKLSHKTISGPTQTDCGGFKWVIQWLLDAGSPKGGWVAQHVKVTADIQDCKGNKIPLPNASWWPLWEAWKINKGKKVTTYAETGDFEDDTYAMPSRGDCTKGTITIEGSADFYEDLTLPPAFKVTNKLPTGILPSTQTDPKLTGGSGAISHTLTATWNCCEGKVKKTTITTK